MTDLYNETLYEKMRRQSAFFDGVKSRREGQSPLSNPYTHDTDPSRHSWTLGWMAGARPETETRGKK